MAEPIIIIERVAVVAAAVALIAGCRVATAPERQSLHRAPPALRQQAQPARPVAHAEPGIIVDSGPTPVPREEEK